MANPLDQKEVVTAQELAVNNMLEIEALRQLLFEKGMPSLLGKMKVVIGVC